MQTLHLKNPLCCGSTDARFKPKTIVKNNKTKVQATTEYEGHSEGNIFENKVVILGEV